MSGQLHCEYCSVPFDDRSSQHQANSCAGSSMRCKSSCNRDRSVGSSNAVIHPEIYCICLQSQHNCTKHMFIADGNAQVQLQSLEEYGGNAEQQESPMNDYQTYHCTSCT